MKRKFKINGKFYSIPESEVAAFLADNPGAVEVKPYEVNGKKYNIPVNEAAEFEKEMGLGVKKKESSFEFQPTPTGMATPGISSSQPSRNGSKKSPFIESLSDIPMAEPVATPESLQQLKNDELVSQRNMVGGSVYAGSVTQPELYSLYKAGGKQEVTNLINQYAPEMGNDWMDGDLFHTIDKWDTLTNKIQAKNRPNGVALLDKQAADMDAEINNILANNKAVFSSSSAGTGGGGFSQEEKNLALVDPKDPSTYGRLISELSSATGLLKADGSTDFEGKQKLLDLIKQRSVLLSAVKPLAPEINDRSENIALAVSTINSDMANATNVDLALKEKNQYTNEVHFKAGLNHIKDTDPSRYKNIIRAIDEEETISKRDYRDLASLGQEITNLQKFRGAAEKPEYLNTETELDYRTDEDIKTEYARIIGERAKAAGLKNISQFTEKQIKSLAADLPYQNIVNTLIDEEQIRGYDAIPKSGGVEAFVQGVQQPLYGIGSTVRALSESPAETYLRSTRTDTGASQLTVNNKGELGSVLPSDRGNVWYDMLRGAGQFIPQVVLTRGIGGPLARTLAADARLGMTASQQAAVNTYGGTILSTFAQSYGNAYADALQKTGDYNTARIMGTIDGISSAAWETILPDVKIADKIFSGLKKGLGDDLVSILKKGGNPADLAREARPFVQKFLQNTANIAGQEIAEEDGTQFTDYVTEAIFSPRTAADRDLVNEVIETTKATAISMALPSIFGGGGAAMNKDFTVSALHSAAINLDEYKDALKKSFDKGLIPKEDMDRAIKFLSTHQQSIATAPKTYEDGSEISGEDRMEYAYQNTLSKYWKAKAEQEKSISNDEVQIQHFENKAKEADDEKRKIFSVEPTTETETAAPAVTEGQATSTPQDVITQAASKEGGKLMELEMVGSGQITPDQAILELAKQKYGVSDDGTPLEGGGRELTKLTTTDVDDAVTTVYPDQKSVINALKPQPAEQVDESAQRSTESLSPEAKQKFDTVDQEINDLSDTIDREGGLNDRIEQAEMDGQEARANNLRIQRDDIYKQLIAKQKQQDELFGQQQPAKGSMVGQTIKTNRAGNWEVVADLGDRVRLFNPENGATITTKKSALPQQRTLSPEVQQVVDRLSVDEATASKIQDIRDEAKNVEEFKTKVKQLLFGEQNPGTSQTDQTGPLLNVSNEDQAQVETIAQRTADFANEQVSNITRSSQRSVEDARTELENDGGVVWQEFPNGERMDVGEAGGTATPSVDNRESRTREGNERLHNFGFGLYDGSTETDPSGQQLQDVISGEGFSDRQRGMAAAYLAAQRLLNNQPPNFIGKLFQRAANKSGNPRGRIRIYYNENPESGLLNAGGGAISINAYKLGQRLKEFGGEKRFMEWLESALGEEVIHLATARVTTDQELSEVYDEMTDEQRQAVKNLYKNQDLNPGQVAMEFIRQVFQEKIFGTATELFKPKESALSKIRDIARKTLAFIKRTFSGADSNRKAKEIMDRMQAFIDGKDVAIPDASQQAATDAGTSGEGNLDDMLEDLWNAKDPNRKPRKKRFTQEMWQQQIADDQVDQATQAGEYNFGNFSGGNQALDSFPMKVRDVALMPFQTDVTMQKAFNMLPSEDRYKAQFDMLEDGKAMIAVAQASFGGDQVAQYGAGLYDYIKKMPNDINLLPKKIILMGTFLGEIQTEMMRDQQTADKLRPLYDAVYKHYRNYMHQVGRGLNAGKVVLFFKDKYMNDLFSDEILDEDQAKANRKMRTAESDVDVDDKQTEEYFDNKQKGMSDAQAKKSEEGQKAKRAQQQKKGQGKKASKKETFGKAAEQKEQEITKKYGGKSGLINTIIDAIKKLNCK